MIKVFFLLIKQPSVQRLPDYLIHICFSFCFNCLFRQFVSIFDKKQLLANKGIKLSNPKQKPLFDYPKYLKGFDCLNFQIALNQWIGKTGLHFDSNNLMDRLSPSELKYKTELFNQLLGLYLLSHSKNLRHLKYDHDSNGLTNILKLCSSNEFFQMFIKLETLELKDTIFHENWVSRAERFSQLASRLSICNRNLQHISISLEIGMKKHIQLKHYKPILDLIKCQNDLKCLEICEFWNPSCSELFFDALKDTARIPRRSGRVLAPPRQ